MRLRREHAGHEEQDSDGKKGEEEQGRPPRRYNHDVVPCPPDVDRQEPHPVPVV
ncbi:hypothetical protein D3C83_144180 [compost metagenome]